MYNAAPATSTPARSPSPASHAHEPAGDPADAPWIPLSVTNFSGGLRSPAAARAAVFNPQHGGGELTLRRRAFATPVTVAQGPREALQCPDGGGVPLPATSQSGTALLLAWRGLLHDWTVRQATELHEDMNPLSGSFVRRTNDWNVCVDVVQAWLQGDLAQILEATGPGQLCDESAPLPQALRDAVLRALEVEIEALGVLDDVRRAQADAAREEVHALLLQPAEQALQTEPLRPLFAALHAKAVQKWPDAFR